MIILTSPHCMAGQSQHWSFPSQATAAEWLRDDANFPYGLRADPDDAKKRRQLADLIEAGNRTMCYGIVWKDYPIASREDLEPMVTYAAPGDDGVHTYTKELRCSKHDMHAIVDALRACSIRQVYCQDVSQPGDGAFPALQRVSGRVVFSHNDRVLIDGAVATVRSQYQIAE